MDNKEITLTLNLGYGNNGDIAMLLANIAEAQGKIEKLNSEKEQINQEKNEAEEKSQKCEDYAKENQVLKTQIEKLRKEVRTHLEEKEKLQHQLGIYEGEKPIVDKIQELTLENKDLSNKLETANQEITNLEREINTVDSLKSSIQELKKKQNDFICRVLERLAGSIIDNAGKSKNPALYDFLSEISRDFKKFASSREEHDWYEWVKTAKSPMARCANLIWWYKQPLLDRIIEELCPNIALIEEVYTNILLPLFEITNGITVYLPDGVFKQELSENDWYERKDDYNKESFFGRLFSPYSPSNGNGDKVYCEVYSLACSKSDDISKGFMFKINVELSQDASAAEVPEEIQ